ncbi:MAG: 4'-phosphopantetheinyl transferase superfamily protein [Gemmatimonadetes bacterium]|nr:4'-phosphopantetheinyl transferase superfamily protein [Gemmatimonadota bacterium]
MAHRTGRPLTVPVHVGNDIVDLDHPRCRNAAREERFLDRVLGMAERDAVRASPDPHRALWLHWAAKEAAFKVAWKVWGERPMFAHARFAVSGAPRLPACPPECDCRQESSLEVTYAGTTLPVRATVTHTYVHTIAAASRGPGLRIADLPIILGVNAVSPAERDVWRLPQTLARHFTDAELAAIRHPEAAIARVRAREAIAAYLGIAADRIRIVRDTRGGTLAPPTVQVDDRPAPVDLSLSHHGRFVAWAFHAAGGSPQNSPAGR